MRLSHARRAMSVRFDDPNLVSCAGLAPVLALAARCGLATLLTERLRIAARGGANATAKILALIAGMIAGADSIDDMDLLRHGGMGRLFTDVRAPSTLGTFLRVFTFGHVRQLDAVAAAAAGPPRRRDPDPARPLHGGVRRHRRHRAADLRLRQAGRRARLQRRQRTQRAARDRLHAAVRAGDRRDPAAQRRHELGARRRETAGRRAGHRGPCRGHRAGDGARGLGVLQLPDHRRRPPRRGPVLRHRPPHPGRDQRDHHHRATMRGPRSTTRTRSGTTRSSAWSPTPRSPRSGSPRSPAAAAPSTSPPG